MYFRTPADLYALHEITTRSEDTTDSLIADMGYHYLRSDYVTPDHAALPSIRLVQSSRFPLPGETYSLMADVFMIGFGTAFTCQNLDIGPGDFSKPILQFTWPDIPGTVPPDTFYCAFLTSDLNQIFGEWDSIRLTP